MLQATVSNNNGTAHRARNSIFCYGLAALTVCAARKRASLARCNRGEWEKCAFAPVHVSAVRQKVGIPSGMDKTKQQKGLAAPWIGDNKRSHAQSSLIRMAQEMERRTALDTGQTKRKALRAPFRYVHITAQTTMNASCTLQTRFGCNALVWHLCGYVWVFGAPICACNARHLGEGVDEWAIWAVCGRFFFLAPVSVASCWMSCRMLLITMK